MFSMEETSVGACDTMKDVLEATSTKVRYESNQQGLGEVVRDFIEERFAQRKNAGKPELSYIVSAPQALCGLANVFSFGAKKYARDNWKQGFTTETLVDSALRHLLAYMSGEDLDLNPETGEADENYSGLPHVDLFLWNAMVLSEQYRTFPDRRPSREKRGLE